jgi:hypothetical protein
MYFPQMQTVQEIIANSLPTTEEKSEVWIHHLITVG